MKSKEISKIVLGTAQFGMDYGINNQRGKIPKEEVFEILEMALENGVDTLDTAPAYGESESVIGEFQKRFDKRFNIISKLPKVDPSRIESIFYSSLENLNTDYLYGYLYHSFQYFQDYPESLQILQELKEEKSVKKIGFSLYKPEDLDVVLRDRIVFDLVQLPYSVFDRRFEPYFPKLRDHGVEIHVRSIFLQGVVFKSSESLDGLFLRIKKKIQEINAISNGSNIPKLSLYFNFVALNQFVDKIIVGVDSLSNFRDILQSVADKVKVGNILDKLSIFQVDDEEILLPFLWNKSLGGAKE